MTPHDTLPHRDATHLRLTRALASDREAVRGLVAGLTPVIQARAARALLRRREAAGGRDLREELQDLTQHVFLVLFADDARLLRDWDPGRGASLENFVGLVAEREISSMLRSLRRNPWTDVPTEDEGLEALGSVEPGPELSTLSRDLLDRVVARARVQLSQRGVEMLHWLFLEERTVDEIGVVTGMTAEAVYAWRSRLLRRLQTIAAELLSDSGASPRIPEKEQAPA